nr:transposase [Palleronia caenipelagi]
MAGRSSPPSGKRGTQRRYSDLPIEACLTMRVVLRLALRHRRASCEVFCGSCGLNYPCRISPRSAAARRP